jgi:SulP family sulfate permease
MTWIKSLRAVLPEWIAHYPRVHLPHDLSAGILVAILAVPQSLAYAVLAGLPPQMGLYVSILPTMIYAWIGSSMVQSVGPVAITAIMTLGVLEPLAVPGTDTYIALAGTLALMSGVLLCLGSLLRLGYLSQILSRPVIQGFISGTTVLILLNQVYPLLGMAKGHLPDFLGTVTTGLSATAILGLCALVLLLLARHFLAGLLTRLGFTSNQATLITRLVPLLVVIGATALVSILHLDQQGVKIVGAIPEGMPALNTHLPSSDQFKQLVIPALLMALIGMVQNIAVAQALAIKRREKVNPDREIMGLGAANLAAAMAGGMPVGGGVSRSALNVAAGAQTPLASLVAATGMLAIVYGLSSQFKQMPLAVLAASIIVAAIPMLDLKSLVNAWRYDRKDAMTWVATFGGVIFLGLDRGVELGIVLSLATILLMARKPHIAQLGKISGTEHFRNVKRHRVETIPGTAFLRIDENLFFGNLAAVEEALQDVVSSQPGIKDIILVMNAVNHIDVTAAEVLEELNRDYQKLGITLHLSEVKGPVQDRLEHSAFWSNLSGQVFLSTHEAFTAMLEKHGNLVTSPGEVVPG